MLTYHNKNRRINSDSYSKSNPEEECPKCGGDDGHGLCSSGDQAGCPCEEKQNCPNEPPRCSDDECGGDVSPQNVQPVRCHYKILNLTRMANRNAQRRVRSKAVLAVPTPRPFARMTTA